MSDSWQFVFKEIIVINSQSFRLRLRLQRPLSYYLAHIEIIENIKLLDPFVVEYLWSLRKHFACGTTRMTMNYP